MTNSNLSSVPVIDFKKWTGSDHDRSEFLTEVGDALRDVGFFILDNHSVHQSLVDNGYIMAKAFFDLSLENKLKLEIPGGSGARGYTRFGAEHAKDSDAPDLKEFLHIGNPTDSMPGSTNLWANIPGFRTSFSALYLALDTISKSLLDACSLYIGEEKNFLRNGGLVGGMSILRVLHYPPVSPDRNPASVRAAAHEDINLITILPVASSPGLEILGRDGTWIPVGTNPGQIIVDSGDMIQNLTNGLFKSTTHRVVNPDNSRDRRFSMPFFAHPDPDFSLAPRPNSVAMTGGAKIYDDITAGEYLQTRLREIGLKK
jgi:isopenicillin N synthase-like dioxygenase